jgi:hypothetical protein
MLKVNMGKAKEIAHDIRRRHRAEKFAPLDVKATIPVEATYAEEERQAIRDLDARLQEDIGKCTEVLELKELLDDLY